MWTRLMVIVIAVCCTASWPNHVLQPNYGVSFTAKGVIDSAVSSWTAVLIITEPVVPTINISVCSDDHPECRTPEVKEYEILARHLVDKIYEVDQAIKDISITRAEFTESKRYTRAPLSFIGSFGKYVFGLALEDDVSKVSTAVNQNRQLSQGMNEKMTHFQKSMLTLAQVDHLRISNLWRALNATHDRLFRLAVETSMALDRESQVISELQTSLNLVYLLIWRSSQLQAKLTRLSNIYSWLSERREAYMHLLSHRLPPALVSREDIAELLRSVDQQLKLHYEGYQIKYPEIQYYYKHSHIDYFRAGDALYITIQVPVEKEPRLYFLYEVNSFPLPTPRVSEESPQWLDKSQTVLRDLPNYFAISKDGKSSLDLTMAQYKECTGDELKRCDKFIVLQNDSKSCVKSLFTDDLEGAHKLCKLDWIANATMTPHIMRTNSNTVFITSSGKGEWKLKCPLDQKRKKYRLKSCYITVPCACELHIENRIIPARISDCSSNTSYAVEHTSNFYVLRALFEESRTSNWTGNRTFLQPWVMHVPGSDLIEKTWNQTLATEGSLNLDFERTTQLIKNQEKIYASKVDQLALQFEDLSVTMSIWQQMINFGDGSVILSWISISLTSVVGIVLGYKMHRMAIALNVLTRVQPVHLASIDYVAQFDYFTFSPEIQNITQTIVFPFNEQITLNYLTAAIVLIVLFVTAKRILKCLCRCVKHASYKTARSMLAIELNADSDNVIIPIQKLNCAISLLYYTNIPIISMVVRPRWLFKDELVISWGNLFVVSRHQDRQFIPCAVVGIPWGYGRIIKNVQPNFECCSRVLVGGPKIYVEIVKRSTYSDRIAKARALMDRAPKDGNQQPLVVGQNRSPEIPANLTTPTDRPVTNNEPTERSRLDRRDQAANNSHMTDEIEHDEHVPLCTSSPKPAYENVPLCKSTSMQVSTPRSTSFSEASLTMDIEPITPDESIPNFAPPQFDPPELPVASLPPLPIKTVVHSPKAPVASIDENDSDETQFNDSYQYRF